MGFLIKKIKQTKIITLILLGLGIRLFLATLPAFEIDMNVWIAWSSRLVNLGFANFYSKEVFTDYTPGFMYLWFLLGQLKLFLNIPDQLFIYILKIPFIISEVLLGILIYYQLIKDKKERFALISLILILFNPALIFNSSIWGQLDSLLTLVMFLSLISLANNNLVKSSTFLAISFLLKPQAFFITPIFFGFILKHFNFKDFLKLVFPFLLIIILFSLPFFPNNPIFGYLTPLFNLFGFYNATSLFAYNFWGLIGFWVEDSNKFLSLNYQIWGILLTTVYLGMITYLYLKNKLHLYAFATLSTLIFFFLLTRVHERYLYTGLVFLIFSASFFKNKLLIILAILLSLIHFLNLYYVQVYYNEFYLNLPKTLYNSLIYNYLDNNGRILSVISTLIFFVVSYLLIKHGKIKT